MLDPAVAAIIGAAFGRIVASLTDDMIVLLVRQVNKPGSRVGVEPVEPEAEPAGVTRPREIGNALTARP